MNVIVTLETDGNSKKIYSQGETTEIICPKCKEQVNFSVFTNFELRLKAEFPLFKAGNIYFAVCPNCSSVFGIDEDAGKVFKKGEKLAVLTGNLKELDKFEV